jgi:hypothetical protein
MLEIIVDFHKFAERVVNKGAPIFKVMQLPVMDEIMRMKTLPNGRIDLLDDLDARMNGHFEKLEASLR